MNDDNIKIYVSALTESLSFIVQPDVAIIHIGKDIFEIHIPEGIFNNSTIYTIFDEISKKDFMNKHNIDDKTFDSFIELVKTKNENNIKLALHVIKYNNNQLIFK